MSRIMKIRVISSHLDANRVCTTDNSPSFRAYRACAYNTPIPLLICNLPPDLYDGIIDNHHVQLYIHEPLCTYMCYWISYKLPIKLYRFRNDLLQEYYERLLLSRKWGKKLNRFNHNRRDHPFIRVKNKCIYIINFKR
jgi:hypothetical protein